MTTAPWTRADEEVATLAGDATESPHQEPSLAEVVAQMQERLDTLPPRLQHQRVFLSTYQRTTIAVGAALAVAGSRTRSGSSGGTSRSPSSTSRRSTAELAGFAAVRGRGGWRSTPTPACPPLRHVLLGINAHVNYDLPQALLAVISDDDFTDDARRVEPSARPRAHRRGPVLAGRRRGRRARRCAQPARPRAHAAEPAGLEAFPARGPSEGVAQHGRAAGRAAAGPEQLRRAARASSSCSAPRRSRTCSRRDRSCCGWRWPASG